VLISDQHTESRASKSDLLTWRRLLGFPCTTETKSSTYTACAATGRVACYATCMPTASGRAANLEDALHGGGMAGFGGGWWCIQHLIQQKGLERSSSLETDVGQVTYFFRAAQKYGGNSPNPLGDPKGIQSRDPHHYLCVAPHQAWECPLEVDIHGRNIEYHAHYAVKCSPKLHGLIWSYRRRVLVHVIERIIHNPRRAMITVRYDANWNSPYPLEFSC
jgi:hypothetical protein